VARFIWSVWREEHFAARVRAAGHDCHLYRPKQEGAAAEQVAYRLAFVSSMAVVGLLGAGALAAHAYAQDKLLPRVTDAFRHEASDPAIFREMGALGLLALHLAEHGLDLRGLQRRDGGALGLLGQFVHVVLHRLTHFLHQFLDLGRVGTVADRLSKFQGDVTTKSQ
jgi:hypothetical protein